MTFEAQKPPVKSKTGGFPLYYIYSGVGGKSFLKSVAVLVKLALGAVHIHIVVGNVYYAKGDVGAVVGDALKVGKQIGKHKTYVYGTFSLLQTFYMAGLDFRFKAVYNLL